jgi:hypothetical protein
METLINEQLQKINEGRKINNSLYYSRHRDELKRKRDEKKEDKPEKPIKTPEELRVKKQEYNRRYQTKLKAKKATAEMLQQEL